MDLFRMALELIVNTTDWGTILPISPFKRFFSSWNGFAVIEQYLGYLNWFIPISIILDMLTVWLLAIGVFYAVQTILRWIKVVGD